MTDKIQAILFNKNKYNLDECKNWLEKHNFEYISYRTTKNKHRFRIHEPSSKYKYRIKKITSNIEYVLMYPKIENIEL